MADAIEERTMDDPSEFQAAQPRWWRTGVGRRALLGAVLGAFGAGALLWQIHQLEQAVAGVESVALLQATRDLPPGAVLRSQDLTAVDWPARFAHAKAVPIREQQLVVGRTLAEGLAAGEIVLWSTLAAEARDQARLAAMVPPGERAVAVGVDGIAAVGYFVQPGDRVDLFLATRQHGGRVVMPVLQNVSVLAAGDDLVGEGATGGAYGRIVVAVTPREAELLLLAQQAGKVHLLLRNEDDITAEAEFPVLHEQELWGGDTRKRVQEHRNERIRIIKGAG